MDLLSTTHRLVSEYIMSIARLPPYVTGPVQPLPETIHAFVHGQLLPGFPSLPARQVLQRVQTTLRTGWICQAHRQRSSHQTACECELDNYGNVLLQFANGAVPMYVVRSISAYHPLLSDVACRSGFARGWMRRGPAIGDVPCFLCRRASDGGPAGFPGCDPDCLAPTITSTAIPSPLAKRIAEHTDDVLRQVEPSLRVGSEESNNICAPAVIK
jgi:hypothetical protein